MAVIKSPPQTSQRTGPRSKLSRSPRRLVEWRFLIVDPAAGTITAITT
jgi:hypothetical protein